MSIVKLENSFCCYCIISSEKYIGGFIAHRYILFLFELEINCYYILEVIKMNLNQSTLNLFEDQIIPEYGENPVTQIIDTLETVS